MAKKKNTDAPFNFYGARKTKNPKYFSVSACRGDGELEFVNIPIKADNVRVKDGYAHIKIKFLEPVEQPKQNRVPIEDSDLPF